jgi:hypothetical protein
MKRIKKCIGTFFLITAVMSMTACGTMTRNGTTGTTATSPTIGATTGAVDRAVDRVQEGVDRITGETNGQPTTATSRTSAQ